MPTIVREGDIVNCPHCKKKTGTVYNDFMVAFCAKCGKMRGKKSDYTGQTRAFECCICGILTSEKYVGQTKCSICAQEIRNDA